MGIGIGHSELVELRVNCPERLSYQEQKKKGGGGQQLSSSSYLPAFRHLRTNLRTPSRFTYIVRIAFLFGHPTVSDVTSELPPIGVALFFRYEFAIKLLFSIIFFF